MKILYVLIAILFFFGFVANYEFKAQCPPNWSYVSIPLGPDASDCFYQVEFCYKCGITGGDPSNLRVLAIKPINPQNGCIAPNQE